MQFSPSELLKPFIKSYSIVTLERDLTNEVFYPSGHVDLAINLGGHATTIIDGHSRDMPHTEVLGQLTVPTRLTVKKGTSVLLARIHPFAGSLFLPTPVSEFSNYAVDLNGVFAGESRDFYDCLIHADTDEKKISVLDRFLVQKFQSNERTHRKTDLIRHICMSICEEGDSFDIRKIAARFGLSARYIQQLFLEVVGTTPRSFFNIQRFNKSVNLVLSSDQDLTSIAYDCGYYDQAHFIKEFRKFTGITPSQARPSLAEGGLKFQQAVNIGL